MSLKQKTRKLLFLIQSDLFRYTGETSVKAFVRTYAMEPGFNFMTWLRLRSIFKSKVLSYILHTKRIKFGIDIQTVSIGEGFYIGHFGHIVVSGAAVIGRNCNISHGVTIGVANTGGKKGVPVIGDNVYIGPGAKLIGKIRIGNHAAIGANCVVLDDVPDNAVVVGVPGRVVSMKGSSGYVNRVVTRWEGG